MLKLVNFSRQAGTNFLRACREQERPGAGHASLARQAARPRLLLLCLESSGPPARLAQAARSLPPPGPPARGLLQALQHGAILALGYSLLHDRAGLLPTLLQEDALARRLGSGLADHCPAVALRRAKTLEAQPLVPGGGDQRLDQLQEQQLVDKLQELRLEGETSDYSSQPSSGAGGREPAGLTEEERALLALEKTVVPLELEAVAAITAVRRGEGTARLERVAAQGSATAQHYLAMALEQGLPGLEAAPARATLLYRAAAAQGHPEAMYNLAVGLLQEDPASEEGRRLLAGAAELGLLEARQAAGEAEAWGEPAVWLARAREWEAAGLWLHAIEPYRRAALGGSRQAAARYRRLRARLDRRLTKMAAV